jgi:hypothetical protein
MHMIWQTLNIIVCNEEFKNEYLRGQRSYAHFEFIDFKHNLKRFEIYIGNNLNQLTARILPS